MDLRQLRYLVAVSDEGGMRAAARTMHVSQAQVSRSLRELEREVGVSLLSRSRQGVRLTPAGAELVGRGREVLVHMAAAETAMRALRTRYAMTLRVGVAVGVLSAGELLAPIVDAFRAAHENVALSLGDLGMQDQLSPLLRAEVDAAIVRLPLAHPDVDVTPIAQEPRLLFVNLAHELAHETRVAVADILHFPTMPLDSRPEWCDFWELNDQRGFAHRARDVVPAKTVGESQLGAVSNPVILMAAGVNARLAANPLLHAVRLEGLTPSVIAVARLKRDTRRIVRGFVEIARTAAERNIALLPEGTLPT